MATNAVVTPLEPGTLLTQTANTVTSDVVAMYHKHMLQVIAIFIVLIAMIGGAFAYVVHSANVRDAAADVKTQAFMMQLQQQQKDFIVANQKIASDTTQQQAIVKVVQVRDQAAQTITQTVTKPDNTVQQVATDSATYLKVTPTIEPDNTLAYQKSDVQGFIANKVDLDTTKQDLTDSQTQLSLEEDKFNTVSIQLTTSEATTTACNVALTAEQKARAADKRKNKFFIVTSYIAGFISGYGVRAIQH